MKMMKRKILRHSLTFAIGMVFFLAIDYVFAETVIYDPVNPKRIIIPMNEDEETTISSTIERTENTINAKETKKETAQNHTQPSSSENTSKPKKAKKKVKNQVVILDEEYFLDQPIISSTPQSTGGTGGTGGIMDEFSDISQGAYLLSGTVLYGNGIK